MRLPIRVQKIFTPFNAAVTLLASVVTIAVPFLMADDPDPKTALSINITEISMAKGGDTTWKVVFHNAAKSQIVVQKVCSHIIWGEKPVHLVRGFHSEGRKCLNLEGEFTVGPYERREFNIGSPASPEDEQNKLSPLMLVYALVTYSDIRSGKAFDWDAIACGSFHGEMPQDDCGLNNVKNGDVSLIGPTPDSVIAKVRSKSS